MKLNLLLISALMLANAPAQEKPADPYLDSKATLPASAPLATTDVTICYEVFSLPLTLAAKLQRERLPDSEFYSRLVSAAEKDMARLEIMSIIHARSGHRATLQSASEQLFPREYEPPEIPHTVGVAISPAPAKDSSPTIPDVGKLKDAPDLSGAAVRAPCSPAKFENRNVGFNLEIEPTLSPDGMQVDLVLAPENVTLVGRLSWGQEIAAVEMPLFEAQRITTSVSMRVNHPCLIGTMNRPAQSKVDAEAANRVWLAFATATLPKP